VLHLTWDTLYMSLRSKSGMGSCFTMTRHKIHFNNTISGYVFLQLSGPAQPNVCDKMRSFFTHVFHPISL
jgi:hypothetical protein